MATQSPPPGTPSITLEEARHVAKLARLALTDDKLRQLTHQLQGILGYVNKLKEVDVTGIEPMAHALPLTNVFRDDVPTPALDLDQVLANAPDQDSPFFKVPKVLGGDEDSAG